MKKLPEVFAFIMGALIVAGLVWLWVAVNADNGGAGVGGP